MDVHKNVYNNLENEEKKQKNPLGLKESGKPKVGDAFRRLTKIDPGGEKQSNNSIKENYLPLHQTLVFICSYKGELIRPLID